jgi:hypothetical protein
VSRKSGHEAPPHHNSNEDLPDWVHGARTGAGIARVRIFALLSEHEPLRRFFAELGHRSGVIERNAIRLEEAPSDRRAYRALGLREPGYERFRAALRPWHPEPAEPGATVGMSNAQIEVDIYAFIEGLGFAWPWLGRAAVGAFTWYVYEVARELAWTAGNVWDPDNPWTAPPPTPTKPPDIANWYWNETEKPRLTESKRFAPFYVERGDSIALARSRLAEYVQEVEAFLSIVERPAVPPGSTASWRKDKISRNVGWLFRRVVLGETLSSLAVSEFAPGDSHPDDRAEALEGRRKDIRQGIDSATKLLREQPYRRPILTLDEFEQGRMTL